MVNKLEVSDLQLLSYEIWEAFVLENIKLPSLAKFDGRSNPYEHTTSINTQMDIIGAPNSLKCKIMYGPFIDKTLS